MRKGSSSVLGPSHVNSNSGIGAAPPAAVGWCHCLASTVVGESESERAPHSTTPPWVAEGVTYQWPWL